MSHESVLILIILLLSISFIIIGYILGQINSFKHFDIESINKSESFFKQQKNNRNDKNNPTSTIDIDDTKVVIPIKTDGLEKKYQNLGNTQTSSENISDSVNKLKNMKR